MLLDVTEGHRGSFQHVFDSTSGDIGEDAKNAEFLNLFAPAHTFIIGRE